MEKFKLLVNETDAIVNLLIKQCNKLANIENLIQIKKLCQSTTNEELVGTIQLLHYFKNFKITKFF